MSKKIAWRECIVGRIETDITTFWMLAKMGFCATKLWNACIYSSRKQWTETGKIPSGFDLQSEHQEHPRYADMNAHAAQKAIHEVGESYRSWYTLRKKDTTAQPPGFRKKTRLSSITYDTSGFRRTADGNFALSISKRMRSATCYPHRFLSLKISFWRPIPEKAKLVEMHIIPRDGYFEAHVIVELPEPEWRTEGATVGIDMGQIIPCAVADETGAVELYKGGEIASNSRYWNKELSRVKGEVMGRTKGHKKWSEALSRMSQRSRGQKNTAIHALTSTIANKCNKDGVKEVVTGDLKGIKKDIDGEGKNWGKVGNQNWQAFPVRKLVTQLRYKLARFGIRLLEKDEQGTSRGRCSLCGCVDRKKLHRIHRGMFYCENCERYQHADANGARNILARYLHQEAGLLASEGSSGALAAPVIRRWDDHTWGAVA